MSYNIFLGGLANSPGRLDFIEAEVEDRTELILEAVAKECPDFLAIQEANYFERNSLGRLHEFRDRLGYSGGLIGLGSTSYDGTAHHVASFTGEQIVGSDVVPMKHNAALVTLIESQWGQIALCNCHLSPRSEEERVSEVQRIISDLSGYEHAIFMGDLNSLSAHNEYDMSVFNEKQARKFTDARGVRTQVADYIEGSGFVDVGRDMGMAGSMTVPTEMCVDLSHGSPLRLDYMFATPDIGAHVKDYAVIKNDLTNQASDHYPIVMELI